MGNVRSQIIGQITAAPKKVHRRSLHGDGLAQLAEVGQAGLVQNDDLAVDDRTFHLQFGGGFSEVAVFRCPVETVAGENPHALSVPYDLGAVAVELDLMSPSVAFWGFLHQGRHQRFHKF